VITVRRKSTVHIMSNQACAGVLIAEIGKVGVPSVSVGYGAADNKMQYSVTLLGPQNCCNMLTSGCKQRHQINLYNKK